MKYQSQVCHNEEAVRRGEDVRHDEDIVCGSEERIYVTILVLSQSRLLNHNSQACTFFPNSQQSIYIYIYIIKSVTKIKERK